MRLLKMFISVLAYLMTLCLLGNCNIMTILTPLGEIKGRRVSYLKRSLDEYLGIPFAKPLTQYDRFKKAKPIGKYDSVIEAYGMAKDCPESTKDSKIKMDEDCLYLNIWSPTGAAESIFAKPVMFWITGKNKLRAFHENFDGKTIAAFHNNVIVVSANYRTGSFGFLTTGDVDEPGNLAFYDQNLALRWVQDNIAYFGGDPSQVTVFGQEGGSISISFHLLSGKSRGLFNRAILQSGFYYTPHLNYGKEAAVNIALQFAMQVGCATRKDSFPYHRKKIMRCLRSMPWEDLLEVQKIFDVYEFFPVLEEEFARVGDVLNFPNRFHDVDVILGITADEGNAFIYDLPSLGNETEPLQLTLRYAYKYSTSVLRHVRVNPDEILPYYLSGIQEGNFPAIRKALSNLISDRYYVCPALIFANAYARKGGSVRFYFLTYHSENDFYPQWVGATHGSDLSYTLGRIMDPLFAFSEEDTEFSKHCMYYWTRFAKGIDMPEWHLYEDRCNTARQFPPERPGGAIEIPRADLCYKLWEPIFEKNIKSILGGPVKSNIKIGDEL